MSSRKQNIRVTGDTLNNLVVAVEKGQYRIPQFQRDYVWEISKVTKLFDSIYHEYPIGSFFLWKANREHNNLFRSVPGIDLDDVRDDDDISFILDGQQRITSLYITLKGLTRLGTDYSRVCFDLKEEKFIHRNPDRKRFIAVCDMWGPESGLIYRGIEEQYIESYDRCARTLTTYPVSIVEVRDKDLAAVCSIFQRINQGGKRLDRFDLIAAMTFDPDFDLRERVEADIVAPIKNQGFGTIPRTIVTQLIALKTKGSCLDTAQFGLTRGDLQNNWKATIDALMLAIDFLKSNCYVIRFEFLPYNPIIVLVAYYFLRSGARTVAPEHIDWLTQWFWRSTFGLRYGAGGATRIGQDSKTFDSLIAGSVPEFDLPCAVTEESLIQTKMTLTGSAIRCGFLCLLASKRPVHLKSNAELNLISGSISEFTSTEKHHIFPQAFLHREGSSGNVHSLPNFCFIPAELNKELSDKSPSDYFSYLAKTNSELDEALSTHLIPPMSESGVENNDYQRFLQTRAKLVLASIEDICGWASRPAKSKRYETVGRAEKRIRDFIDFVLSEAQGNDYWATHVPGDVQDQIKRLSKTRQRDSQSSSTRLSSREKLDLCDSTHYQKMIVVKQNWPFFEKYLGYKSDVETHLKAFSGYRNCVMHNRDMPKVTELSGEAALTWISDMIPSIAELRGITDLEDEPIGSQEPGEPLDTVVEVLSGEVPANNKPKKLNEPEKRYVKWDYDTYIENAKSQLSEPEVDALKRLESWSRSKSERVNWGAGAKVGSFGPVFSNICSGAIFTAFSDGNIFMNFGNTPASPQQRENMLRCAAALESKGLLTLDDRKPLKYPHIKVTSIANGTEEFIRIIETELKIS